MAKKRKRKPNIDKQNSKKVMDQYKISEALQTDKSTLFPEPEPSYYQTAVNWLYSLFYE